MISIYQTNNGSAPAIHWWLSSSNKKFGPQLYDFYKFGTHNYDYMLSDEYHIGSMVVEMRENANLDNEVYDLHQESMRQMENYVPVNDRVDCVSNYFNGLKNLYEVPVWSNYFGCCEKGAFPASEKLIYCNHSEYDICFFYITQYAFTLLDEEKVHNDSKLWWQDHKFVDNAVTDNWKEIWYKDYQPQVLKDFENGKLKYMWQLNFSHWDLQRAISNGKTSFDLDYGSNRLFEHKLNDVDHISREVWAKHKDSVDHLGVSIDWFDHTKEICDYVEITETDEMKKTSNMYKDTFLKVRDKYDTMFGKYIRS